MKIDFKKSHIKLYVPALLAVAIAGSFLMSHSVTQKHISAAEHRHLFEQAVAQSNLLLSKTDTVKDYGYTNIGAGGTRSIQAVPDSGTVAPETKQYKIYSENIFEFNQRNPVFLLSWIVAFLFAGMVLLVLTRVLKKGKRTIREDQVKLVEAINIDPLTGLFNKPGFETETKKRLEDIPPKRACAFVTFEIVSFRSYNYLYGFDAGNELLIKIADIVRTINSNAGVGARMYADHFVMFADGVDNEEIFSNFRKGVLELKNTGLPVFLCGGIYIVKDRTMPVLKMTDRASVAKDTIKYKFGTGIAIYNDSMLECQIEDAELVGSMMQSLNDGEFVDYYQPKYNVATETISGAEVLVRWKKPSGEIIQPGRFIELFEKNGFIRKLDYYTFEKACKMLGEAIGKGHTVVPVSVNFSRVHLYDANFPQRITNIAKKYNVDTRYLEIELTESAFLMKAEELIKVVDKLHEYGFSVAIDDFGSGFSSLNMLKDIPADVLKIDMKFLEGFENGGKVGTVVTSVIRMAKWLGISVIAEGVETKEQVEFLRTLGCDMIQGYFYSRPVPRKEFEALLEHKDTFVRKFGEKPTGITLEGINAALGGNGLITALADAIFGGVGLYELVGKRLEAIRVNKAYCELMGYPDMAAFSAHSLNVLTQIYPPDAENLLDICAEAVKTGNVQRPLIHRYDYNGNLRQFQGLLKHIGGMDERPLFCVTFLDVTEKNQAEKERELEKLGDALASIFDEIWEFNYTENTCRLISEHHIRLARDANKLDEVEKHWLDNKIYPDDRDIIEKEIAKARADELKLPSTIEYRKYDDGAVKWITSSMVRLEEGSYLLCNIDITGKKQTEMFMEDLENT